MIVSVHIEKTGGSTFRNMLKTHYRDRMLGDYSDLVSDDTKVEKVRQRLQRVKQSRRLDDIRRNKAVIHGHFHLQKWIDLLGEDDVQAAAFLRNPVTRTRSQYDYMMRVPNPKTRLARTIQSDKTPFAEYIEIPAAQNVMSKVLAGRAIEDYAFVGLQETFVDSVAMFNQVFDCELIIPERSANTAHGTVTELTPELEDRVAAVNAADMALFERAKVVHEQQMAAVGLG